MLGDHYWTDLEKIVHVIDTRIAGSSLTMCGKGLEGGSNPRPFRGCDKCALEVALALESNAADLYAVEP